MACSICCVVGFGIFLAVMDILHALATVGFYGYEFLSQHFYICPQDLDITVCQSRIYFYDQLFGLRVYIGLGEGGITPIFVIIYIVALVKHKPWLTWFWLLKSFGVIGINIYFISGWLFRRDTFQQIDISDEHLRNFLYVGAALTVFQATILLLFCLIGGIFSYKIVEERKAGRRSLQSVQTHEETATSNSHQR